MDLPHRYYLQVTGYVYHILDLKKISHAMNKKNIPVIHLQTIFKPFNTFNTYCALTQYASLDLGGNFF